jgi:hypothetical protein
MNRPLYERAIDRLFCGEVSPWPYALLRVGLAAILLLRHADWLRKVIYFEHHRWVTGLDFMWSSAEAPHLVSPLVPGLVLTETTTFWLVYMRTALAVLLLAGVRSRAAAVLLAVVSYSLFAADRYRYFHHLHLLYVSIAWLALAPIDARWSLERRLRHAWRAVRPTAAQGASVPRTSPVWPLQMIRALVMSVYLASGLSKLHGAWLGGETLQGLHRVHVIGGATWNTLHEWLGYGVLAKLTCVTELALPALLAFRSTRGWAIGAAIGFHALISASMGVSTFGIQMVVLLLAFWPRYYAADGSKVPGK